MLDTGLDIGNTVVNKHKNVMLAKTLNKIKNKLCDILESSAKVEK